MKIDCHVHLFCLSAESGGYTRLGWLRDLFRPIVARRLRIHRERSLMAQESLYIDLLADQVRSSELDRAVLLSFDRVYGRDGSLDAARSRFYVPNAYARGACDAHPDAFLFGASVHPYRADAIPALERWKAAGAALVKLLPNTHGFDPADPCLSGYYRALADLRLPLLIHGGYEHTIPISSQAFGDPSRFRAALDEGVTLIVAHGGSAGAFHRKETFGAFLELIEMYPNCFGDTAALGNLWRAHYLSQLRDPELLQRRYRVSIEAPLSRFVHGSDYPIPISPLWFGVSAARRLERDAGARNNALQADVALKRIAGVPDSCLTRAHREMGIGGSDEREGR